MQWDWKTAEEELKQALFLNPNSAQVHMYYAWFLTFTGKSEEAVAEIRRAQELDPLSGFVNTMAGRFLHWDRRIDEAIKVLRETNEMFPNYFPSHNTLGECYLDKSMYNEAITEFEKAVKFSGESPMTVAHLSCACYMAGDKVRGDSLFL